MAIKIPGGFVEICNYGINSADERRTDKGKVLRSAFNWGPSDSVKSNGKIIIESGEPVHELEGEESKETNQDKDQDNKPTESTPEGSKPAESTAQAEPAGETSSTGRESYAYTLCEAFTDLHAIYERTKKNKKNKNNKKNNKNTKSSQPNNTEPTNNPQQPESSDKPNEQTDNKEEAPAESTQDKESQEAEDLKKFKPGEIFYAQVLLPGEGCTIWKLQLDQRANPDKVKNAIRSKNFKAALTIAGKGLSSDGLVPLAVKSYMNKNATVNCPFIGHCRYAFDSGSDKSSPDTNTVCIAIAPIDPRTNGPNEETVFKAEYNIVVGDITGGIVGTLVKIFGKDKEKEYSRDIDTDEKDVSDEVSKYLNKRFKCVGDQSMYDNFLNIRNFVEKNITDKNLEYNEEESESVVRYSKVGEFANKTFFCY